MRKLALLAALLCAPLARADEGMWTYNNFPKDKVQARYGFTPSDAWLKHAMMSSARLAQGCSASFVSPNGLVMTNHHCAHSCIEQLSNAKRDYVQTGFYAKTEKDEVKCPELEVNQLVEITDVTKEVTAATAGLEGEKRHEAQVAVEAKLEKACATSAKVRCDVVSLYHGGVYDLYKYNRYQDVRLVFAPEFAIAFFGGDPDNFNFPRYDLDVSFVRVYDGGKPADTSATYFPFSPAGAKEGDLTFVSGHPGGTDRQLTVAQLEYQRDVALPEYLLNLAQLRGVLTEFGTKGKEMKRISDPMLFGVENSYKALKGRWQTLLDKPFFDSKVEAEKAFRAKVMANPELAKKYGGAWDEIARAIGEQKAIHKMLQFTQGRAFGGRLFGIARGIVQGTAEIVKPNERRYPEYADSNLPAVQQHLFSKAPIYPAFEKLQLTYSLTKLREELGADDPFVKQVLGKKSPEELADALVDGTRLRDPAAREALWKGGVKAIEASKDPMIVLARAVDPVSREWRKKYETEIEPVITKNSELIARARFDLEGASNYPDATFTLRLSYGAVKGYEENGHHLVPVTTFAGAFDRATGADPFKLPESWIKAKPRLDLATPFNMATDNDIIGGNSGSPVFNKDGQIVGLIFDGNIQSLGGEYGFDDSVNRAVAVESVALTEALSRIYGAERLLKEIEAGRNRGAGSGGGAK